MKIVPQTFLKLLMFFFCAILDRSIKSMEHEKFILITSLYNEIEQERISEYLTCLSKNLEHELIHEIIVLYDTARDNQTNTIRSFLEQSPVKIITVVGRPTFQDCFDLVNKDYPGRKIIIANADIYFNETLFHIKDYDLANKFIALTRWNVQKDGSLAMYYYKKNKPAFVSQDTWIFLSPIKKFAKATMQLGSMHCDGKIALQAKNAGLKVLNPCYTIQTCHLHLTNIRHYIKTKPPFREMIPVRWSHL